MATNTNIADATTFPHIERAQMDTSWQEFTLPGEDNGAAGNKATGWRSLSVKAAGNVYISWDQTLADDGTPAGTEATIGASDGWLTWTAPVEVRRQAKKVFIAAVSGTPIVYLSCESA